ncbi:TIGR00341 family protein, partial [Acinetobacter lactucae]|nr:TIGR00341 family protein [Acinetobacter lactucae]
MEKKDDATIIVEEKSGHQKYEVLKEKLRYKQALRANTKKIDHKNVRLNIQADALPSKTFFIMNALAAIIAGYGLLADSSAVVIGAMLVAMMLGPISGIALSLIDNRWILFRT